MDLAVTVGAAAVEEEPGIAIPRGAGMLRVYVTLSAKSRIRDFQQPVVYRAVRLMAIGAIFNDRRMFPEKRPAPFRMTGITVLVNACLF